MLVFLSPSILFINPCSSIHPSIGLSVHVAFCHMFVVSTQASAGFQQSFLQGLLQIIKWMLEWELDYLSWLHKSSNSRRWCHFVVHVVVVGDCLNVWTWGSPLRDHHWNLLRSAISLSRLQMLHLFQNIQIVAVSINIQYVSAHYFIDNHFLNLEHWMEVKTDTEPHPLKKTVRKLKASETASVWTFFSFFRLKPEGLDCWSLVFLCCLDMSDA